MRINLLSWIVVALLGMLPSTFARAEDHPKNLGPRLSRILSGERNPGGPIWLRVVTRKGAKATVPMNRVKAFLSPKAPHASCDDASGRGHLWLRVAPEEIEGTVNRLLAGPEVIWVAEQPELEFKNDNSSWLIQSGSVDT
ncbi:MAG: hypothetical protein JRF33_25225, partial [Deltaproteobacteria bacterium]|nr:hypothetical protein [Deltaproteobacteria bacterium]